MKLLMPVSKPSLLFSLFPISLLEVDDVGMDENGSEARKYPFTYVPHVYLSLFFFRRQWLREKRLLVWKSIKRKRNDRSSCHKLVIHHFS